MGLFNFFNSLLFLLDECVLCAIGTEGFTVLDKNRPSEDSLITHSKLCL